MKFHKLFLSILLFTALSAFGQSDFRPGYVITNESDTLHGFIDYRGDLRLSAACVFKENFNSDPVRYAPGEIFSYRFQQGKYYISKELVREDGSEYRFLEFLVNGIADLYYYRSEKGDHYLIEKEDGSMQELTNELKEVYIEGVRYSRESKQYIGMLKATFSDCLEVQSDIESAKLSHKSLIDITSTYHDYVCEGEQCIIYEKEIPVLRARISPVFGMGYYKIGFELVPLFEDMAFDPSLSPELGMQLHLLAPRLNEKISVQFDFLLAKHYHYGYKEEVNGAQSIYYDAHLNTAFLNSGVGFKYTYPKGKVRPTLAFGGLASYLFWSNTGAVAESVLDNTVRTNTTQDLPLTHLLLGLMTELGADMHVRPNFILFAKLRLQRSYGIDNQSSTQLQSISALIGFYF